MNYRMEKSISLTIMFVGMLIEIIGLFFDIRYFDGGALIFLIGLVINNIIAHRYLIKYINKYGDLDED